MDVLGHAAVPVFAVPRVMLARAYVAARSASRGSGFSSMSR